MRIGIKPDSRTELQFMEQRSKTIFICLKNEPNLSKVPEIRGQMRSINLRLLWYKNSYIKRYTL